MRNLVSKLYYNCFFLLSVCSLYAQTSLPANLDQESHIVLDGVDQYIQRNTNLIASGDATIMTFFKYQGVNTLSNDAILFGQNNFYVKVTTANYLQVFLNGSFLIAHLPSISMLNKWNHIAVTTSTTNGTNIYYNGELVASDASGGITTDTSLFTIGRFPSLSTNFFFGGVDEVKVFDIELDEDEILQMIHQKVDNVSNEVVGEFTNISSGIDWSNLIAYYRMDNFRSFVIDDYSTPNIDLPTDPIRTEGYNIDNIVTETSPLPYKTTDTMEDLKSINNATLWEFGSEWNVNDVNHYSKGDIIELRDSTAIYANYEAYAVKVNRTKLIVFNSSSLTVNGYLKFESTDPHWGTITFAEESQLLQPEGSVFDPSSLGWIDRSQQGNANSFSYNYYCSPVGGAWTGTNNAAYNLATNLRDGTTPFSAQYINFCNGAFCADDATMNISNRWIYKFINSPESYENWQWVGSVNSINFAEGFTMKGPYNSSSNDLSAETQNYIFTGHPNNAPSDVVAVTLGTNNMHLTGNPFPSALDANAFIAANSVSTTQTLYFWEHWSDETHNLSEYEGGYATYNLSGGTPASSYFGGTDKSRVIPGQYVPIAQGFVVKASATGGDLVFNNNQRAFVLEDGNSSSNFVRPEKELEKREQLRIGFVSPENIHRQVLISYTPETTNGFDAGYDSESFDQFNSDAFMLLGEKKLVIQSFDAFDVEREIPLYIKVDESVHNGLQKIMIDDLINTPSNRSFYVLDKYTGLYYDLRLGAAEFELSGGEYTDRFVLVFEDKTTLSNTQIDISNKIMIYASDSNIKIENESELILKSISLYNIQGQQLDLWENDLNKGELVFPVDVASGVYIVNVSTNQGSKSYKIYIE